jgi:lysophospholipase L1-like esterase
MPDALHPSVEGYREWAKAMEPMLTKLLGKQSMNFSHLEALPLP